MAERYYVAIEGPIGVGKTTLARLIHEQLEAELLLEVFEENPFLSDFYADREKYAFQTQIFFLLSRYRQQHQVIAQVLQHSALVSDYTFANQTVTIPAGQTETIVALTILSDTLLEPPETLTLSLSHPVNAFLGSPASATVTILDAAWGQGHTLYLPLVTK